MIRYIKDWSENPVAVFILEGNNIGWSACNWKKGDTFCKKQAVILAKQRFNQFDDMPHWMEPYLERFLKNPKAMLYIPVFSTRGQEVNNPIDVLSNPTIAIKMWECLNAIIPEAESNFNNS
jgi:hypothetical protein